MTNQSTTLEHEPFDETAKAFFKSLFQTWGISVETEREVFSHSRKIDLVVTCTDADRAQLQFTVFAHFQKLNALELKGINDPLTVENYFRIMMRVWALGDQEYNKQKLLKKAAKKAAKTDKKDDSSEPSLLANQLTVTIICVTRPDKMWFQMLSLFWDSICQKFLEQLKQKSRMAFTIVLMFWDHSLSIPVNSN
jgi:hypothetical protein